MSAASRIAANPSVEAMRQGERIKVALLVMGLVAVTAVALCALSSPLSLALLVAAIVAPATLAVLWRRPVIGVYVLFGGAVLLETVFPAQAFADDIGSYVPFFEDLATWTHIKGLSYSLAEILMALVLLICALKGLAARKRHFDKGSLLLPLGLYMLMIPVSELHGISSGGDFKLSLWEVRAQVYMFVAYILTCNLVKTRRQITILIATFVAGTGLRGVQGIIRYFGELHGNIHSVESLFAHEQSFFFNTFVVLAITFYLYGGPRALKRIALIMLPFVLVADLANQRRAATVALGVALIGLLVVTLFVHRPRRRMTMAILLTMAVAWPPYYEAYKHSEGLIGQPARAVYSNSNPDPRDASSNQYRINEDADIIATMKSSTLNKVIGYGFGKTMLTPYPLADISSFYIFWNLLPHNSILWIWMRLGTIGYVLFWILIAAAIVQAIRLALRLNDPYLKGLAVFIALTVMQEVIFGYLDLQWTNDRNLITMGVLLALLSRLALVAASGKTATVRRGGRSNGHRHTDRPSKSPEVTSTLAVVGGRLKRGAPTPVGGRP